MNLEKFPSKKQNVIEPPVEKLEQKTVSRSQELLEAITLSNKIANHESATLKPSYFKNVGDELVRRKKYEEKQRQRSILMRAMRDFFIKNISTGSEAMQLEAWKKFEKPFQVLEKKLHGSALVDLGAGEPEGIEQAYVFANAFDCQEYVGVEKHFTFFTKLNSADPDNFTLEDYQTHLTKAQQEASNEKKSGIPFSMHQDDMLVFLTSRNQPANFMLNGIDEYIIPPNGDGPAYREALVKNLERLTLPGNIVFGSHFDLGPYLAEKHFKQICEEDIPQQRRPFEIWERT